MASTEEANTTAATVDSFWRVSDVLLTLMISSAERGMASTMTQVTGTFFLLDTDVLRLHRTRTTALNGTRYAALHGQNRAAYWRIWQVELPWMSEFRRVQRRRRLANAPCLERFRRRDSDVDLPVYSDSRTIIMPFC